MPLTTIHTGPPTHPALHIRDARDAHIVLEAVRLNMLPLIRRRITASEREQLVSGNVFVWEEAENDGGLLRWTDGRRWSQSRMRGDYLFYEEKMETTQEEKEEKAALRYLSHLENSEPYSVVETRARLATDPTVAPPPTNRRKDRPNRPNGLTKQTYSALVYLPGADHPRKWHIVAYFAGNDYVRLPVIENYDYLRDLRVPNGIFVSSKANGMRGDRCSAAESKEGYTLAEFHARPNVAHYPQHATSHEVSSRSTPSASSTPPNSLSPMFWHPYSPLASSSTPRPHAYGTPLLTMTAHTSPHPHPGLPQASQASHPLRLNHPSPSNYRPLSAEDRRVLNSFRVVL